MIAAGKRDRQKRPIRQADIEPASILIFRRPAAVVDRARHDDRSSITGNECREPYPIRLLEEIRKSSLLIASPLECGATIGTWEDERLVGKCVGGEQVLER